MTFPPGQSVPSPDCDESQSTLELPWDRTPSSAWVSEWCSVGFEVPPTTVPGLIGIADACGSELDLVLLGVFAVLLHRYSGQAEVTVAHTTGEPSGATRVVITDETSLAELVGQLQKAPVVTTGAAKGHLDLRVTHEERRLTGELRYDADVFEQFTALRAVGHLLRLAESASADPALPVGLLTLLTIEEEQLLAAVNGAVLEPGDRVFHQVFEEQAERTPDRVAVRSADEPLTYRELNERANQLAHLLRELGVGPGVYAGIHADRGARALVAMMAVLKAGGAYVPVDVTEPLARRDAIMVDAGVVVEIHVAEPAALPAPEPAARSAEPTTRATIVLDPDWAPLDGRPTANASTADSAPDDAAYVLYTSGTTGRPKGVVVENRNLIAYVRAVIARLDADTPLNWAVVQPLSVDSCVTALMPPLCTGGEVHLIPRDSVLDPDALADWAVSRGIDCMKIAPSHLRALQSSPRFGELLPRRRLIVGCEASDWQWLRELQRLAPECRVFNHYGPTETTVGALTLDVGAFMDGEWDTAPLGFPLAGTQVQVVDAAGRPVPAGVAGEIVIGGAGVARGYHSRPELTEAVFVPAPEATAPAGRMFRTGDFGRRLPDGMICFLGRRDDQVKVRGFRIALGEIDAVLRGHRQVRNGLTLLREGASGERRLVAYVEPHAGGTIEAGSFDAYLAERLPSHMVPQVVVMEKLPLAGNGKVSRRALPVPPVPDGTGADAPGGPLSDLQQLVATAWSEVLGTDVTAVDDNFFDVGGHSLLLVTLQQALQRTSGRRVNILELFKHTTVRRQAELLAQPADENPPSAPVGRSDAQQNALMRRRNEQLRARRDKS